MMTTQTNDNSGGTGYSAGNDFTIKPLTTTVDIKLIRRLMATWHTNGLSDSNIRKILLLYLGEPAWMDLNKVYPCGNFYNIAKSFHFNCKTSFLKTLMSCKEFGYIWKDKRKVHDATNLLAFYTPIWHKEDKEDMMSEDGSNLSDNSRTTEDSTQNTENSARYNSLYDNIIKKNIKKKENNYYSSAPKNSEFFSRTEEANQCRCPDAHQLHRYRSGCLHQHRGNHQRNYAETDAGAIHRQEGGMPRNHGYPSVLQRLPLPLPPGAQRKNDEDSYAAGAELLDQESHPKRFHAEEDFGCRQRYPALPDASRSRDDATEPPHLLLRIPGQGNGTEILRRQKQRRNHQADPNTE